MSPLDGGEDLWSDDGRSFWFSMKEEKKWRTSRSKLQVYVVGRLVFVNIRWHRDQFPAFLAPGLKTMSEVFVSSHQHCWKCIVLFPLKNRWPSPWLLHQKLRFFNVGKSASQTMGEELMSSLPAAPPTPPPTHVLTTHIIYLTCEFHRKPFSSSN